jgi:hypothetical protein
LQFIATATGSAPSGVGHGLAVKTKGIQAIEFKHDELGHFWLLDTPGLDEATGRPDTKIHDMVASWLQKKYV